MSKAKPARDRSRKRNREGSVYQTADGRWRGTVAWVDGNGVMHRRYTSGRTADEAREKLTKVQSDVDAGDAPHAKAGSLTLGTYLDGWIGRQKASPDLRATTWLSYEGHVRLHIKPAIGSVVLTTLKPSQVEAMTAALKRAGKGPTAVAVRVTLRVALNAAMRDGLVRTNAAALARPPRIERREATALEPEQARSLIAGTKAEPQGPLLAFLLGSGMRLGEATALRWQDVDLDAGTVTVRASVTLDHERNKVIGSTKTAKSRRVVRLSATEVEALRRQQVRVRSLAAIAGDAWQASSGLVFPNETGGVLSQRVVADALQRVTEQLGLPSIRVHDLRHSAASLAVANGQSLVAVSRRLGHVDATMLMRRYAHAFADDDVAVADAMDRALGVG